MTPEQKGRALEKLDNLAIEVAILRSGRDEDRELLCAISARLDSLDQIKTRSAKFGAVGGFLGGILAGLISAITSNGK